MYLSFPVKGEIDEKDFSESERTGPEYLDCYKT
jgi:hypothetical protein